MGEFIAKGITYVGAMLIISIFIGWWSIPLVLLNGIAQALWEHYQEKKENDPEYRKKQLEEFMRERAEKEAEYERLREENLRRYYQDK